MRGDTQREEVELPHEGLGRTTKKRGHINTRQKKKRAHRIELGKGRGAEPITRVTGTPTKTGNNRAGEPSARRSGSPKTGPSGRDQFESAKKNAQWNEKWSVGKKTRGAKKNRLSKIQQFRGPSGKRGEKRGKNINRTCLGGEKASERKRRL